MGNIVLESLGNQCSNQYNHIKNSMYLCTTTLKIWSLWLLFTWVRSRLLWPTLAEDMVLSSSGSLPENHRNSRDGPILLYVPVTQWGKLLNSKLSILILISVYFDEICCLARNTQTFIIQNIFSVVVSQQCSAIIWIIKVINPNFFL